MRRILLLATAIILAACASSGGGFNPTTPAYKINTEALKKHPIRKVVIASANISGEPTRYYLRNAAVHVDELVKRYLEKHGITVVPNYVFDNGWDQAIRTYGNMYDPTTGKVDPTTYRAVMLTAFKAVKDTSDVDAVVFTDVIESQTSQNIGLDHLAQWDGVSRKPAMANAGIQGVTDDFNWNEPVRVATLVVTIYSTSLQGLFSSRGGLDVLDAINTKGDAGFKRRKHPLDSDDNIEEGIAIAFHPLIKMPDYPGKDQPVNEDQPENKD